jgi:hypothetical protein
MPTLHNSLDSTKRAAVALPCRCNAGHCNAFRVHVRMCTSICAKGVLFLGATQVAHEVAHCVARHHHKRLRVVVPTAVGPVACAAAVALVKSQRQRRSSDETTTRAAAFDKEFKPLLGAVTSNLPLFKLLIGEPFVKYFSIV